jgi:hypothetical protein
MRAPCVPSWNVNTLMTMPSTREAPCRDRARATEFISVLFSPFHRQFHRRQVPIALPDHAQVLPETLDDI